MPHTSDNHKPQEQHTTKQSTSKAYTLKVPKSLGEKTIKLAVNLGLLERNLKIMPEDDSLLIPLAQKPIPAQVREIQKALPQYSLSVHEFPEQTKPSQTAFEVVADQLPPHLLASFPRSTDFIGEIAVMEVPQELWEHRALIGEAVLKAHKHVRTVLAKSSAVKGVRRLREYEVIAGLPSTITVHREHGCTYHLDLSKAYFSPRLSHEHLRVASQVQENETVVDMFAGIGPFSVLAAKLQRNVKVYAVDVNPDAVQYLERNAAVNKVLEKVVPILGDVRQVIRERLLGKADRVIMNLPEKATEYVDAACEALKNEGGVIHFYEFSRIPAPLENAKRQLSKAIKKQNRKVEDFLAARIVREVAPRKWQVVLDTVVR
jgi:tRNA (guanine37-N1)-methyltransferase